MILFGSVPFPDRQGPIFAGVPHGPEPFAVQPRACFGEEALDLRRHLRAFGG